MAQPTPPSALVRGGPAMPSCGGDVDERGPVVAPQRVGGARLVGQEQIEIAVVVDVEPAGADRGTRVGRADADEDVA